MDKEEAVGQNKVPHQDDQLNQFGRPKQKVIFYELTEDMKKQAQSELEKDKMIEHP